jgi:hypothetical protein
MEKISQKVYVGFFCHLKNCPKKTIAHFGENSPDLVTLFGHMYIRHERVGRTQTIVVHF